MAFSFNIWPTWAQRIEKIQIQIPTPWRHFSWDKSLRQDLFHTPGLKHHPGMDKWWKLFRVRLSPHSLYRQRVCHMWLENPSIGWNIWIYFRGGAAVAFEVFVARGLPRILKGKIEE